MADINEVVFTELKRRGLKVSYEYPGFINLALHDGWQVATSDLNPTWTVDLQEEDGNTRETLDTGVPRDCADVAHLATMLERAFLVIEADQLHTKLDEGDRDDTDAFLDTDLNDIDETALREEVLDLRIANAFVNGLRQQLTAEDFAEMKRRNMNRQEGICHSHDFCDANMVMDAAFRANGITPFADSETCAAMWSRCWDRAMPSLTGNW